MTASDSSETRAWLRAILKKNGMSPTALAKAAGISHTTITRALDPKEDEPNFRVDTIVKLTKLGGIPAPAELAAAAGHGFAEQDAVQLAGIPEAGRKLTPAQSQWTVKTSELAAVGLMPGDRFIIDDTLTPRDYDVVMANVYDLQSGGAKTVLRVYHDHFLVTPNYLTERRPKLFVDNNSVVIKGVLVESWRRRDGN